MTILNEAMRRNLCFFADRFCGLRFCVIVHATWLFQKKTTSVTKKIAAKPEPTVKEKLSQTAGKSVATLGLGNRIHARFAALGGVHLPVPDRTELPRAAQFDL